MFFVTPIVTITGYEQVINVVTKSIMIKRLLIKTINNFGYEVKNIRRNKDERIKVELSMRGALKRCQLRNIDIQSVIDVGASNGGWSEMCMGYFPNCNYILVEANKEHETDLKKFSTKHKNAKYKIIAAGDKEGEIYFDNSTLFGGLASHEKLNSTWITVPVTSISTLVKKFYLGPPYMIKLDTHGFEIPILEGAKEILPETNLLVIEVYNFLVAKKSLRFFELCEYLKIHGFLPIELVDFTLRKLDNSFWQMDIFFMKQDSIEFQNNNYK